MSYRLFSYEVITAMPRMTAINAAIEVDITGQVCADTIGEFVYSGNFYLLCSIFFQDSAVNSTLFTERIVHWTDKESLLLRYRLEPQKASLESYHI